MFSLVSEYIIFLIFTLFLLCDFIESQHVDLDFWLLFVKSVSKFLKYIPWDMNIISSNNISFSLLKNPN